MILVHLAPVFILFEMLQLLMAERYLGVKQIKEGKHPLEGSADKRAWVALLWLVGTLALWIYMALLVFNPWGGVQGFVMIMVSLAGLLLRRSLGLRYALIILTLEGAVRIGLLVNLMVSAYLWGGALRPPMGAL